MAALAFRGIFFAFAVASILLLYSVFFVIPSILILPLSTKYSRILYDKLWVQPFQGYFVALVELVYQTKVVISGDIRKLDNTRPTLIISNHRCRIDFFFLWCLLFRLGSLANARVVTKKIFENLPAYGWALSMGANVFVQQNRANDESSIKDTLQYYREVSLPVQLVLFPEGAPLMESNKKKDDEFAIKKGMELYQYIMHPRTTGFINCVNALKTSVGEFDICNVSIGYVGKICNLQKETLKGDFPSEIHFNVERVPYSKFSVLNDEQLENWLQDKWRAKEHQLKAFHQNSSFNSSPIFIDNWSMSVQLAGYLLYGLVSFVLFLYFLPWTLLIAIFFSTISFCVHKFKGGWSRILLNRNKKRRE